MTEKIHGRTKNTGESEERVKRSDTADPIPEPSYSVEIKKTDPVAISESKDPQKFPFHIKPHIITSSPLPITRRKVGIGEDLIISPTAIEQSLPHVSEEIEPEIEIDIPQLRIWRSARLRPVAPLHQAVKSAEVSLPPRNLMEVKPLEGETGEYGTETEHSSATVLEPEEKQTDKGEGSDQSAKKSKKGGGDIESREPPDIYELLFQMSGGSGSMEEPLCIVAETRDSERYQQTLETLCREQFRQLVGGRPLADLLASTEADSMEATRVQNRIVSYDDSDDEYFKFVGQFGDERGISKELLEEECGADLARLHSRLDEFFTQTLGYLLLFVDERYAGALYDHLTSTKEIRESIKIQPLRARELPDDVKRELVRLAWGNVFLETDHRDLDTLFHSGEEVFKQAIEPEHGAIKEVTSREPGEESQLHYMMKCFVVDFLLKKENLDPSENHSWKEMKECIQTETQPWASSEIRPDIYNSNTEKVYEIETIYGTDTNKINRTIEKYEGENVKGINIVLPNPTCLRNLDTVHRKTNEKFGKMFENDVRFWTLDINNRKLIPIEQVVDRIFELSDRAGGVLSMGVVSDI